MGQDSKDKKGSVLFRHPRVFYDPQLQIISCYTARYYVRKYAARLRAKKSLCTLSWVGYNRIDLKKITETRSIRAKTNI